MNTSTLAEGLELTMLIGYLNESRDPYLDNYQSDFNSTTLSRTFCVNTLHIYGDRSPSFIFSCFFFCSRTLDEPVLCRNCLILMTKPNTYSYVTASSQFFFFFFFFCRKHSLFLNRPFLSYANTLLQSKSKKQNYKLIAEHHARASVVS